MYIIIGFPHAKTQHFYYSFSNYIMHNKNMLVHMELASFLSRIFFIGIITIQIHNNDDSNVDDDNDVYYLIVYMMMMS